MARANDNWERLMGAVMRRNSIWEMFHAQSRTPSMSSEASSMDDSFLDLSVDKFESRRYVEDQNLEALTCDEIYRAKGIGKTTMARRVGEMVIKKEGRPFDEVIMSHDRGLSQYGKFSYGYASSTGSRSLMEHYNNNIRNLSELGPDDSSRNIVEIIFKSRWLKKNNPLCKIERILKVHDTRRTIQRFENYRATVQTRATNTSQKNGRCAADGNELLRFHCATITCSLGARGSSSLCASIPGCGVCTIIREGFEGSKVSGVCTTASSGRAHDSLGGSDTRRAMLVCRVIAGRVKRVVAEDATVDEDGAASVAAGSCDSVASDSGMYSNPEELHVFNPRAILPCFVVIYRLQSTLDS